MADGTVWKSSTTDLLVDIISKAVKPKVPFLARGLVKPAVKIAIKTVNKYSDKVVPDKVDTLVNDAIVKASEKDWDGAAECIGLAGDMLVDIPQIDDEHERQLFVIIAQALVQGVKTYIESKKGAN